MKSIQLSMKMLVEDEAIDDIKKLTHHIENLVDMDAWPEIKYIHDVTVEELPDPVPN